MTRKENARRAWQQRRANVRKHEEIISREWPLTRREEIALGALFSTMAAAITIMGVAVSWL